MWTYVQRNGRLLRDGLEIAIGYSGLGVGKNNPDLEAAHDLGPLPVGRYTIGAPECVITPGPHGPFVLRLTPAADDRMFGRSAFLIHGDSISHAGAASHGCIILPRPIRERIAASGDRDLEVVAETTAAAPVATDGGH